MEQDVMYEIWQGDSLEASSNSAKEAAHYATQYIKDGPIRVVIAVTIRKEVSLTRLNTLAELRY
jgi:hypothetical protein